MDSSHSLTFESLVQRYRQPMTRAAYHLCGDREAALDVVQETLVDAYRGFDKLREPEKAGAWMYAILRRKVIAYRLSRRPEVELVEGSVVVEPEDAEAAARGIFLDQMAGLCEGDREILAGKYLLGLSYRELAESLGTSEGAVRVRCWRAKERLREILRGVGVDVPGKR